MKSILAYKLGELYKLETGREIELPKRYKQIFSEITIRHIRNLLAEKYRKEDGIVDENEKASHGNGEK